MTKNSCKIKKDKDHHYFRYILKHGTLFLKNQLKPVEKIFPVTLQSRFNPNTEKCFNLNEDWSYEHLNDANFNGATEI